MTVSDHGHLVTHSLKVPIMLKPAVFSVSVLCAALLPAMAHADVYVVDSLANGATAIFVNTNITEPAPQLRRATVIMVSNGPAIKDDIKHTQITYEINCASSQLRAVGFKAYDTGNALTLNDDSVDSASSPIKTGSVFDTIKQLACSTPEARETDYGKRKLPDDKMVAFADYLFSNPE